MSRKVVLVTIETSAPTVQLLSNAASVEKRCVRVNQPMFVQPPDGMIARSTRDISKYTDRLVHIFSIKSLWMEFLHLTG